MADTTVVLALTRQEARFLFVAMRMVGGDSRTSLRRCADNIARKLNGQGLNSMQPWLARYVAVVDKNIHCDGLPRPSGAHVDRAIQQARELLATLEG